MLPSPFLCQYRWGNDPRIYSTEWFAVRSLLWSVLANICINVGTKEVMGMHNWDSKGKKWDHTFLAVGCMYVKFSHKVSFHKVAWDDVTARWCSSHPPSLPPLLILAIYSSHLLLFANSVTCETTLWSILVCQVWTVRKGGVFHSFS